MANILTRVFVNHANGTNTRKGGREIGRVSHQSFLSMPNKWDAALQIVVLFIDCRRVCESRKKNADG